MGFKDDLNYSYDDDILNNFYFSRGVKYIQTIKDLEIQKKGIDKILYYGRDKRITVDEKKRRTTYDDLLVEIMKNVELNKKGWLYYTQSDFIIYWIEPLKKIYILNFNKLQKIIFDNDWVNTKPKLKTHINKIYTTDNISLTWREAKPAIHNIITYEVDSINNTLIFNDCKLIRSQY